MYTLHDLVVWLELCGPWRFSWVSHHLKWLHTLRNLTIFPPLNFVLIRMTFQARIYNVCGWSIMDDMTPTLLLSSRSPYSHIDKSITILSAWYKKKVWWASHSLVWIFLFKCGGWVYRNVSSLTVHELIWLRVYFLLLELSTRRFLFIYIATVSSLFTKHVKFSYHFIWDEIVNIQLHLSMFLRTSSQPTSRYIY